MTGPDPGGSPGPPAESTGRPWRGQSPEERRAARRRRLLDAGLQLFGTTGYAATSLTALCAEGGVSPRHFYELYAGREQLLADLYDELITELGRQIGEAQDLAELTLEARVSAGLRAAVEWQTSDPRRAKVIQLEVIGVGRFLDRHRRAIIGGFAAQTEEQYRLLVEAGVLVDRPFRQLAVALVGAFDEVVVDWLQTRPRPPAQELLPVLEEVFLAVFRSRAVER